MNSVALTPATKARSTEMARRVESLGWQQIAVDLDAYGCAMAKGVLLGDECGELAALYRQDAPFRSRIAMSRHGFGRRRIQVLGLSASGNRGDAAQYALSLSRRSRQPLESVDEDRGALSGPARDISGAVPPGGADEADAVAAVIRRRRLQLPAPGLYGDRVFPLQATFLLSVPGKDFTGGEFVFSEQRPRIQSRAEVVSLEEGDGVIFAVHQRPVQGIRGAYRVNLRHGVSRIRSGHRHTMGMIFHAAE